MKTKERVFSELASFIEREYQRMRSEIERNKYAFKKLEEEQTVLKRKRAELQKLRNYCLKRKDLEK